MEPEPLSVVNATVPGLELTKKMARNDASNRGEFGPIGCAFYAAIQHPKRA